MTLWIEVTSLLMEDYNGDDWEIFLLPFCLNLGCILGCFIQSYYAEVVGRVPMYQCSGVVNLIGALSLCCFNKDLMLHFGILVVGFGMGGDMIISYTILMESVPPSKSNNALTWLSVGWTAGTSVFIFLAYVIEVVFESNIPAWRFLVYIGTVLQATLTYHRGFIYETPMYLFDKSSKDCETVLKNIIEMNEVSYSPLIELPNKKNPEKDQHFAYLTFFLSFEYLFSGFCISTLFFVLPAILPLEDLGTQYIVLLLQQIAGTPGMVISAVYISSIPMSVTIRSISFFLAGCSVLMIGMNLNIWLTVFFTCLTNFFVWTGLSLLYSYSQSMYCTSTRTVMNGVLCGISYVTGLFGSLLIDMIQERYGLFASLSAFSASLLIASVCSPVLHFLISK